MKRSEILESLTVEEAGTGLWEWELGVTFSRGQAILSLEDTKLGRDTVRAIALGTTEPGSVGTPINHLTPAGLCCSTPCTSWALTAGPERLKVRRTPNTSQRAARLLSPILPCSLRPPYPKHTGRGFVLQDRRPRLSLSWAQLLASPQPRAFRGQTEGMI